MNIKKCTETELQQQTWQPSYLWYFKVSVAIFVFLIMSFFTLNILLKPYMRVLSPEITPWLRPNSNNNEN
ncbi:MAG: hypothetical protein LBU55_04190 [Elusimicrobiota bacterium]|jgi:multisubunit Na+/H+ antiporter MnhB subunit|nr:hypothetical protein [Elusimicrobiota bacterium]